MYQAGTFDGDRNEIRKDDPDLSEADLNVNFDPDITDIEILRLAMLNERRIITYYKRKALAPVEESIRELYRELVNEEERHIKIINDQIQSLQTDKIWKNIREIEESGKH